MAQASADLRQYRDLSERLVTVKGKVYSRAERYTPVWPKSASAFLASAAGEERIIAAEPASSAYDLVNGHYIIAILEAYQQRRCVRVEHAGSEETISPHALFTAGGSAFLRGWLHERALFGSLNLTLAFVSPDPGQVRFVDDTTDTEWTTYVKVEVDQAAQLDTSWPLLHLAMKTLPSVHRTRKPVVSALLEQLGPTARYFTLTPEATEP